MRAVIIGLVVVAIMLAGGTAYLLRDYLSSVQAELESQKPVAPTTEVLVAANDLPVGTAVNENNTDWIDWPEGDVPEGFLERTDDNDPLDTLGEAKHLARFGFVKGEPIKMDRLYKSEDPGFLRGSLTPGMRAVSVRTSAENAASGFILPNDRVDLVLTHSMINDLRESTGEGRDLPALSVISETIMHDLRVLAVDQKTNQFEGGAQVGKTMLLEVTPKQAEIIETAKDMGSLTLVLRSAETPLDAQEADSYTTDVQISPMMRQILKLDEATDPDDGPTAQQAGTATDAPTPPASDGVPDTPSPAVDAPAPPATDTPRDITIYRGGQAGATQ